MYNAMKKLTSAAFKIWCYLNCNQNEYELELVNKDTIKLNEQDGLYNKVKTINVYEYDISKN